MPAGESGWGARWWLLAVLLLFSFAWVVVDPRGEFPLNDDWAYAYATRSIVQNGRFALTGFTAPNLIVQAYWGALFCLPFGFSFEALRVSTFVLALLGLFAAYALLRELGAGRALAALGALTLAANPLYLQWSVSFMTDVPFVALTNVALWLYVRGTVREHGPTIVAAFVAALLAMFIRQFGLVLPAAFGLAYLFRRGLGMRALLIAIIPVVLFAAAHVLYQHWVVATGRTPKFAESLGEFAQVSLADRMPFLRNRTVAMIPYFGLFSLPFLLPLLAARPCARGLVFWSLSVVLGGLLFAFLVTHTDELPAFGNALDRFGLGPLPLRDTLGLHRNIPVIAGAATFWTVLTALSSWGTAILFMLGVRFGLDAVAGLWRWRLDPAGWSAALMLGFVVGNVVAIVLAILLEYVFDRYLLVLAVPLCAFLLVSLEPRGTLSGARLALAAAPLAACFLLSIAATHDYLDFNRTRWKATDLLEQQGISPMAMDAGFEYGGLRLFDPNYQRQEGKSWWYVHDTEYLVTAGPMPGYRVEHIFGFTHWLPASYSVYVLRRL